MPVERRIPANSALYARDEEIRLDESPATEEVVAVRLLPKISELRRQLGQTAKPDHRRSTWHPSERLCQFDSSSACLPCDSNWRQLMGKPDAGNLHVRFDEGGGGYGSSPTLLVHFLRFFWHLTFLTRRHGRAGLLRAKNPRADAAGLAWENRFRETDKGTGPYTFYMDLSLYLSPRPPCRRVALETSSQSSVHETTKYVCPNCSPPNDKIRVSPCPLSHNSIQL